MNNFTKEMINDYADKLLIGLSDEETNTLLEEFDVIKENMEIIAGIEGISEVEPLHFPQEFFIDSLREDASSPSLPVKEALQNCENQIEGMAIVPKVVG